MQEPIILIMLGIAALYGGAEFLVRGASQMAIRLGIPPLVVGLTVVAMGTSTPEVIASFFAAWHGASGDIALGNVVGSNSCNIGLIGGLSAMVAPVAICKATLWRETPIMIAVGILMAGLLYLGPVSRAAGIFLVLLLGAYCYLQYRVTKHQRDKSGLGVKDRKESIRDDVLFIIVGLVLLVIGGRWLVNGALEICKNYGVSERVMGVTVVAIGTSLPELATSMIAAWKGHAEISIGNIVGSNIFNVLFVLGGVAAVAPFDFSPILLWQDTMVMLAYSVGLWILMYFGQRLSRFQGTLLFTSYMGYLAWLVYAG